jgi:hypothetical protein
MKINFKKEHFDKLKELAVKALLNNDTVVGRLGNPIDIVELIHGTTINSLNQIRLSLAKKIEGLEGKDEWAADDTNQVSLEKAKEQKDLVNLIIGYKRYKQEVADNKANKKALQEQLSALKESQKTPEDKIKELEAQLAGIETEDF